MNDSAGLNLPAPKPGLFPVIAGIVGVLATPFAWWAIQPFQINVIHYKLQFDPGLISYPGAVFSLLIFCVPFILAALGARNAASEFSLRTFFSLMAPNILALPLAFYAWWITSTLNPGEYDTPLEWRLSGYYLLLFAIVGAASTVFFSVKRIPLQNIRRSFPTPALVTLVACIAALTIIHVTLQMNYYNHFMFGHADIGHFTEELKNALEGRGLRSDSFDNTRLGWHFVPLMFVLVPGYALWPSITYLMTLGPLVLHLGSLPIYWFVRRRSDSVLVAWLCALAWLLLPSLSRLVYSNTYGFAWLYTSVPLLCLLLGAALLQRWTLCWVLVAVLLLSRETHTAVTLGFGAYLALMSARRRAGIVIMLISVGYALLCAAIIIPYFAKTGRFERLDIFGELGGSLGALATSAFTNPGLFFGRLVRPQSINFLLLLMTTMYFLPVRGWKLALAAVPSLLVHLLLQDSDWISIKFWHHAMVLPVLFFAALSTLERFNDAPPGASAPPRPTVLCSRNLAVALALFVSAAWGHYFFGFSPLSKAYAVYARDPFLQNPDPRLAFVERLRDEIPRDLTILATERVAAHFIDYKRLYTGHRPLSADFIILDRSDRWDTSDLPRRADEFATSDEYRLYAEQGPLIVFARRSDAPILNIND